MNRCRVAATMLLFVAGCAVDENKETAIYREVLNAGESVHPADVDPSQPLTVEETMRLANARNESLPIEGERYLQALIAQRRAAAAFLPTITLSPSYSSRDGDGDEDDSHGWDTSIDGDYFLSPVRDIANVRVARFLASRQLALLLDEQDALLLDAARVHYEVIRSERAVEVITNSLTVQDERVRDSQSRFDVGVARTVDVALTQSQAAQTAVDLIEAQNAVATGRSTLAFLSVQNVVTAPLVDSLVVPVSLSTAEELISRAHAHRPDILAADRAIVAAERGVESAYGRYYPAVSLNLQVFLQRETDPTDLNWTSLIRISQPLFSAGLIEQDVREALSILRQSRLFHSQLKRSAARDVETAVLNLTSARDRENQLHVAVDSSQQALDQAEGLFQAGMGTNLERLVAQDRLLTAQLELVNAELDAKVFYLDLLRVTGGLHELIGIDRERQLSALDRHTPTTKPEP
jgi:outer membrane protein TolC